MKENTIVTACDKSYLWGAYILVASLRLGGCKDKIHVLVDGFSESDRGLLMQFNDVKVIGVSEKSHKCMAMQKPDAILTANTELVTWIDSDCMIWEILANISGTPGTSFKLECEVRVK